MTRGGVAWYRRVHDEHAGGLAAYFLRRAERDAALDLVSEAFLVVWRRREDAPADAELRAWLYRIARNVLRNHRRATARRGRLWDRLAAQPLPAERPIDARSDTDERVRSALLRLRPADREILLLHTWECLQVAEIATVLGCSTNAAAVRLHRARGRVRALLDRTGAADARAQQDGPYEAQEGGWDV